MDPDSTSSPPPAPPRHAPPHILISSGSNESLPLPQQSQYELQPWPHATRQPSTRSLTNPGRLSLRQAAANNNIYSSQAPAESAERLLPPSKSKTSRYRDESPQPSPLHSEFSSRRTSWSSESAASRDSRTFAQGPFASPFDDSRAPSRAGSEDEGVNTQTVSAKYNIMPSDDLLIFPEDVEKDDYMHNPDPSDRDGKFSCAELCSTRGLVNVGGLLLITLGVMVLFIGYPILTFAQRLIETPAKQAAQAACTASTNCITDQMPLLQNVRSGLIDPDTPDSAKTRTSSTGTKQKLVFSDEFNDEGRTFYPDDDAYFQGMDFWYGATQDMEWYDPDALSTSGGTLNIRFDAFQNHDLNYRSGMLQSWNRLCFKGGYIEASISLPGRGDTSGFWPGFWTMGNLGRPGYTATTDGMWPYSYHDECDVGITPNQSDPNGLNYLPGMRLPACTCTNQDHPSPGISRSAPEIDAIEASVGYLIPPSTDGVGTASQSFQVAPFDVFWQANAEWMEIYDYSITEANPYQGGIYQEAISAVTNLNNDWYNGMSYQTYGFEYEPGGDGYILWYVGDGPTWKLTGNAIGPNGNIGQRTIPEEPMAIVANLGMGSSFASLNWTGLAPLLPATMRLDYIRIYQDGSGEVTCDPDDYPTTDYIANHPEPYNNQNLTHWASAGYKTPLNSFMHDCTAASKSSSKKKRSKRSTEEKQPSAWLPWSS